MTRSDIRDSLFAHATNILDPAWSLNVTAHGYPNNRQPLVDWLAEAAQELGSHPAQPHMYNAIALVNAGAPRSVLQTSLWCAYAQVKIVIN